MPENAFTLEQPVDTFDEFMSDGDDTDKSDAKPDEHQLIKQLDEGNLVDKLKHGTELDNTAVAAEIQTLLQEAEGEKWEKWKKKYERALHLAKLEPTANGKEIEEKDFPFKGASLAMMPYITEACLDFNARIAPELVWARDIVKAKVYGKDDEEKTKEKQAERVATYQNYQLSEEIPNWRKNQDRNYFALPCVGTTYKETFYDSEEQEVRSDYYMADEIIFNHDYDTFEEAPDKFKYVELTRNEVIGYIRGESAWDLEEKDLPPRKDQAIFEFITAYTWIDLDGDGLAEPYIATIYKETGKIVCLLPNYDEESIDFNDKNQVIKVKELQRFTQYQFLVDPAGGPMGMGWGIVLGPMFDSINTNVRQLIDAGTVQNVAGNSGFYATGMVGGRGNALQSGPVEARIGQLTPLQTRGDLSRNLVQFPAQGPSPTLFQLMEYQVNSARSMTNAASNAEAQPGEAASLYLARLQQSLKQPNSIVMRVCEGSKAEQQLIAEQNFKHFDDEKYNKVLDDEQAASMQDDYNPDTCDVRLVCDPAQGSDVERSARAQAVLEEAKTQPTPVINLRQAYIDWMEAMKVPNVEELAPEPDPNAVDPTQKLILAQQQAEMELQKKDQDLRAGELQVKKMKAALEAAREQVKLGLAADKTEAEIAKLYAEALEKVVNAGLAQGQQAVDFIEQIENKFIDAEGGTPNAGRTAAPASNALPAPAMAR